MTACLSQLLLAVVACLMLAALADGAAQFDVIVIGAGISGLAAAKKMEEAGMNVVVLEARDRLGGRLWTSKLDSINMAIDLGGAWIHGINGNPLWSLVQQYDISTFVSNWDSNTMFNRTSATVLKIVTDTTFADQVDAAYTKFKSFITAQRKKQGAVKGSHSLATLYNRFLSTGYPGASLSSAVRAGLRMTVGADIEDEYGADIGQLSALLYDNDEERDGDQVLFTDGYVTLINALAADLDIRLSTPVTAVDYSTSTVKVTTANGTVFTATRVVCTLPLGYLKAHHTSVFKPALSATKTKAIATLGMGLLDKVVMVFPTAFWAKGIPTDWFNVIHPTNTTRWHDFYNLYPSTGQPVIIALHSGTSARELEARDDASLEQEMLQVLRQMFPSVSVPEPLEARVTRWAQDPWALGAYSYRAVNITETLQEAMSAPEKSRLYFAGEATETSYPSTADGAYSSGIREANRIIKAWKAAGRRMV